MMAVIVGTLDHGESDKIITFFSRHNGRLTGIAKGANKSKKRFQNKLELFSHVSLSCSERQRSRLIFIADAELHSSFMMLRSDFHCYITASFIREILLMATGDGEGDEKIFDLLLWSLQAMDQGRNPLGVAAIFLLRLFDKLGYRPDFSQCHGCGTRFHRETVFSFSPTGGGLVCACCSTSLGGENGSELDSGTIRLLASALDEPLERLHRLRFSSIAQRQSLHMLHRYANTLFQREIQSWKALRPLLGAQQRTGRYARSGRGSRESA